MSFTDWMTTREATDEWLDILSQYAELFEWWWRKRYAEEDPAFIDLGGES